MSSRTRPGRSRVRAAGLVLAAVLLDMSCATGTEKIIRRAVPATIDETLEAFEDPDTQRRLKKLLDLPDVQEAARKLARGMTEGAIDGASDPERAERLRKLSEDYVATLSRAVGKSMNEDISPAVEGAVERTVRRALAAALSPATRRDAAALADALTRKTVKALSDSLRDDLGPALQAVIEDDLGPALRKVIEDDLGPALHKAIAKDLGPAVREAMTGDIVPVAGKMSREVSREVVLGIVDAMAALEHDERLADFDTRFWGRLNTTINQGLRLSEIFAWLLALVVLILGLVVIRQILIRRSLEQERERSERMLIGILHELQRGGEVRVGQVIEKVRERDPELQRSGYLNNLVNRAIAVTRDLFDGKPDIDGKPDKK
jgi:hypothetical protein